MPLFGTEALQTVQEANACLPGAFVQKISAPTPTEAFLELRVPGKSWCLLLSANPQTGRLSIAPARPAAPLHPYAIQQAMRKYLLGAQLAEARAQAGVWLLWQHPQHSFWLWANWKQGFLALGEKAGRWLCFSPKPPEGLKGGMPCVLPPFEVDLRPSRLMLLADTPLPALHAAAALLEAEAKTHEVHAQTKPLKTQLARLQKTMAKVKAETERLPQVQQLQAEAEALAQNLAKLKRGTSSIHLEVFCADGTLQTLELKLNPAKTPKEEMEARFHQAKRLRRGMEIARARLAQLEAQAQALQKQIEEGATEATLAPGAPGATGETGATGKTRATLAKKPAPLGVPQAKPSKNQPYREYFSAVGQRIWVGRGAQHNEVLSFQLAKPWQLWLHARGQNGAHVLVPLNRNEEAQPETLVDAAHLAWHFSNGRKEAWGEVSYVQARYLKKPKSNKGKGNTGAVLLTQEKTLGLRIEKARLDRLLSRPTGPP
ncbi:MAG: NFACT RNA binding domain-containing protein [Cystobacterineae bacterium]|nr:NFACT RNA binding domain-containing protein [Cystobacterineae bacterium]